MSEVVVRMEMPENCECCPMVFMADVPGYHWCTTLEQEVEQGLSRPKDCPIICSLPEGHGRLVDADAYSAEMKDRQDAAWKWRNEAIADEDEVKLARAEGAFTAFVEAKLTWDKQAAIVPAEAESPSPKPTDPVPIRDVYYVMTECDVKTGTVKYELRERSET